ncbi:bifunctional protein-disulfide isomerase/oxidoreductase DsbC [Xenorhabdus stockiae]|uniref:Thiol:disulfide interchange protein n=1 Tax=Xenorhabdus stockiae TaxID=351614 RepID=A0A2D0KN21_9GAMM|nr:MULTISPECIES: bifunctional protein-disulfide isomerase/oxidoreductase DsbC [Xenorhabdus]PHM64820.1 bifunctional protein-disulfide isomerase/oxidoreductase DsbC [Xenorhabdus stockiae]PHM68157.1 bifunctional protein-disulfide isomerase/oxidoreductase DsbC [Xenorhabdus sp. KJ12.1]
MKKIAFCLSLILTAFTGNAFADNSMINQSLSNMGLKAESISPSGIAGVSSVLTQHGTIYLSNDGHYMFQGPLYDISSKIPKQIVNKSLVEKLEALKGQMIIYKAPKEKYVVTVFTDITCGYCRKLHENMKEYNDEGITVRYLAFPRHGLEHQSAKDMQSIWCSAKANKALDAAFKGDKISPIESCKKDIAKHYELGLQFGINGTPAIVLKDGTLISGFLPPKDLAKALAQHGE